MFGRVLETASSPHVGVEATWGIYQKIVAAYRDPDPKAGRAQLAHVIEVISRGVPAALAEIITLGRTLKRRATDVLAYFERPHTSNGPTEALNGRLEHLRGSALGFRNLTNYIARSLLEAGGFRPQLYVDTRSSSGGHDSMSTLAGLLILPCKGFVCPSEPARGAGRAVMA